MSSPARSLAELKALAARREEAPRADLVIAAIPRLFDADLYAAVAAADPSAPAFEQVKVTPGIEVVPRRRGWRVSDRLRTRLLEGLVASDPDRFRRLSAAAEAYFRSRTADNPRAARQDQAEALYHAFGADPERATAEFSPKFDAALDFRNLSLASELLDALQSQPGLTRGALAPLYAEADSRFNARSAVSSDWIATRQYQPRALDTALNELLDGDEAWVVQLQASGGLGKTTFLQNLIARRCPDRNEVGLRLDLDDTALFAKIQHPDRLLLDVVDALEAQTRGSVLLKLADAARNATSPLADLPGRLGEALADLPNPRVILCFDTLERITQAADGDLVPLLRTLAAIRRSSRGKLKVILAGRIDVLVHLQDTHGYDLAAIDPDLAKGFSALTLPPFDEAEARAYLRLRDVPEDEPKVAAILKKAEQRGAPPTAPLLGYIPLKLALMADLVRERPELSAADIDRYPSADLVYLVERVLERVEPPVRWLLWYGAAVRRLGRELVVDVLAPVYHEFAASELEEGTELPAVISGDALLPLIPLDEAVTALQSAFDALIGHAGSWSWVEVGSDGTLVLHPEVGSPLRQLRRTKPAWQAIHRGAVDWWIGRFTRGDTNAVVEAVWHLYEAGGDADVGWESRFAQADARLRDAWAAAVLGLPSPGDRVKTLAALNLVHSALAPLADRVARGKAAIRQDDHSVTELWLGSAAPLAGIEDRDAMEEPLAWAFALESLPAVTVADREPTRADEEAWVFRDAKGPAPELHEPKGTREAAIGLWAARGFTLLGTAEAYRPYRTAIQLAARAGLPTDPLVEGLAEARYRRGNTEPRALVESARLSALDGEAREAGAARAWQAYRDAGRSSEARHAASPPGRTPARIAAMLAALDGLDAAAAAAGLGSFGTATGPATPWIALVEARLQAMTGAAYAVEAWERAATLATSARDMVDVRLEAASWALGADLVPVAQGHLRRLRPIPDDPARELRRRGLEIRLEALQSGVDPGKARKLLGERGPAVLRLEAAVALALAGVPDLGVELARRARAVDPPRRRLRLLAPLAALPTDALPELADVAHDLRPLATRAGGAVSVQVAEILRISGQADQALAVAREIVGGPVGVEVALRRLGLRLGAEIRPSWAPAGDDPMAGVAALLAAEEAVARHDRAAPSLVAAARAALPAAHPGLARRLEALDAGAHAKPKMEPQAVARFVISADGDLTGPFGLSAKIGADVMLAMSAASDEEAPAPAAAPDSADRLVRMLREPPRAAFPAMQELFGSLGDAGALVSALGDKATMALGATLGLGDRAPRVSVQLPPSLQGTAWERLAPTADTVVFRSRERPVQARGSGSGPVWVLAATGGPAALWQRAGVRVEGFDSIRDLGAALSTRRPAIVHLTGEVADGDEPMLVVGGFSGSAYLQRRVSGERLHPYELGSLLSGDGAPITILVEVATGDRGAERRRQEQGRNRFASALFGAAGAVTVVAVGPAPEGEADRLLGQVVSALSDAGTASEVASRLQASGEQTLRSTAVFVDDPDAPLATPERA